VSDWDGGRLVPVAPEAYVSEGELQALVAEQPEILADALDADGEAALVPLLKRMAVATVRGRWPDAKELELHGEYDADWIPDSGFSALSPSTVTCCTTERRFADDGVDRMIDEVGREYLDLLLDLTGDDFIGEQSIEAPFLVN
jgi:hypothetical protein